MPASTSPAPPQPQKSSAPQTQDTTSSIDIRHHNPLPLTANQEAEVREIYYRNVRQKCADEIRDFANCCRSRTISIMWACRQPRLTMETCMNSYATREEEDKAREEWFEKIPQRRRAREEEERWKEDQRRLKREWWGVDEKGQKVMHDGEKKEG